MLLRLDNDDANVNNRIGANVDNSYSKTSMPTIELNTGGCKICLIQIVDIIKSVVTTNKIASIDYRCGISSSLCA